MASTGQAMKCPTCGERVYASDQRCLACGARLDGGRLVGETGAASSAAAQEPAQGAAMPGAAFPADGDAPEPAAQAQVGYATRPGRRTPGSAMGGRGFFDSLSRGWVFLKEAVAMAFRDKDLFIPSLLSVLVNLVLLGGLAGLLYATGNIDAIFGDDSEKLTLAGYIILFVVALISYIVTYFFTGMTVHLVDVHLCGKDAKLGPAFADSVKNFGGIVTLAGASLLVSLLTSSIRGKGRGLRRAAADTIEHGWLAITYLLLPIMILEDSPFMSSADRARKLHAHNVIQIVVGELGLTLASKLLGALITVVGIGIAVGAYFAAPVLLPVGIGLAVLLFVLASAFTAYVRAAFYTCLYLWAVAMETVGEEAPAPAPLQPALSAGW